MTGPGPGSGVVEIDGPTGPVLTCGNNVGDMLGAGIPSDTLTTRPRPHRRRVRARQQRHGLALGPFGQNLITGTGAELLAPLPGRAPAGFGPENFNRALPGP